MVNKVDESVKISIAPSFYASMGKLSEEDKANVMKAIADMSEMTIDELKAKAVCVTCNEPMGQCGCNGCNS